jgi:phospholipid/cholesterol/gamma-HCH transport system substrate-binding protein
VTSAIRKHARDFIAILGLVAIALGTAGYILTQERFRFPILEDKPFELKAEFATGQAVVPGQGQTVRIAGMKIGDIGKVDLKDGRAIVHMEIEKKFDDVVHRDATALLRPRTGLKDMFIEVDPGSKAEPLMEEGDTIALENTTPDVNPDEILSVLDRDTRDYLKLLINGVGKGLKGRSGDLREVFRRLGPLHRDLRLLHVEVAKRLENLTRLIDNYGNTIEELGKKDDELETLVSSSRDVMAEMAPENENISEAVSRLPRTLGNVERALVKVEELGAELKPGFEAMRPVVRQLDKTNDQVRPFAREVEPLLREHIRPFVRTARPYIDDVKPAAENLATASPDLRESFYELNRLFNMLAYNPGGKEKLTGDAAKDAARDEGFLFWLGWVSQNTVSMFNTADAQGPFRRFILLATCSAILNTVNEEPAREPLFGATALLNDPKLCPSK